MKKNRELDIELTYQAINDYLRDEFKHLHQVGVAHGEKRDAEILLGIAKKLGIDPVWIPEPPSCRCFCCCCDRCPHLVHRPERGIICSKDRPCYGLNQVRCIHQIRCGKKYTYHSGDGGCTRYTITKEPYIKDGKWWVDLCYGGSFHSYPRSLADCSVVCYSSDGLWNMYNHLEFADKHDVKCCCCHQQRCFTSYSCCCQ